MIRFFRNQKVLAVGAYSQDSNFNVLGCVIASGNKGEDVWSDVQKVLRQYDMAKILRKSAGQDLTIFFKFVLQTPRLFQLCHPSPKE